MTRGGGIYTRIGEGPRNPTHQSSGEWCVCCACLSKSQPFNQLGHQYISSQPSDQSCFNHELTNTHGWLTWQVCHVRGLLEGMCNYNYVLN